MAVSHVTDCSCSQGASLSELALVAIAAVHYEVKQRTHYDVTTSFLSLGWRKRVYDAAFNEKATSSTDLSCEVGEEESLLQSEPSLLHADADVEGQLEVRENMFPDSLPVSYVR